MSAAYAPEPDDRPDRPVEEGALTERDRRVLDEIAGHERDADPTFADRLRPPAPTASPATERLLQVLAVTAVVAVLVPTEWLVVLVIVVMMVVLPTLLAWYGNRVGPPARRPAPED